MTRLSPNGANNMKSKAIQIFKKYNLEPKKFLGQNFLIDKKALAKIIEAADLKSSDNVLEVGPGLGFLTKELMAKAKKVVSVEIDKSLNFILRQEFKKRKNLELVKADILKIEFDKLKRLFNNEDYKIVANLPYQITSRFLRKFLSARYHPKQMVLTLQREVAERICAKAGQHSLLSLSAQFYSSPKIIDLVKPESFFPQPKVFSAIVKFEKIQKNMANVDEKMFFRLLRIGFSAKRKQLQNNLANGFHEKNEKIKNILLNLGFSDKVRAQNLSIDDWILLYQKFIDLKYLK